MATLKQLRKEIADLDMLLLQCVQKRMDCAQKIAERKHAKKLPIRAPRIEKKVITRNLKLGKALGLEKSLVVNLTQLLIVEARKLQKRARE